MVRHEFLVLDFYRFRLLEPVRKLQPGGGNLSIAKLRQHYEEGFINLVGKYPPPGWTAGRAPATLADQPAHFMHTFGTHMP